MKPRTKPIESPDTPYTPNMRAREERDVAHAQYRVSLTPPPWPPESASNPATERRLARAEIALEDVARREQILANQVKAHRESVAELAEERALFEAERITHAQKAKSAEEAVLRMREQLVLEKQALDAKSKSNAADQKQTEGSRSPHNPAAAPELEKAGNAALDAGELLSRLANQAADFAALAETVTELQQLLSEERTRYETTLRSKLDELHQAQAVLAQRESESSKRISAASLQIDADREKLALEKKEFAESLLKLEQRSSEVAKRAATLERLTQEADEARRQATVLRNERVAFESKVAALQAREKALEEKQVAFTECRRKFRETFSSFMQE